MTGTGRLLFPFSVLGSALLASLFFSVILRPDATLKNSLVDLSILPPTPRRAVFAEEGTQLAGDLTSRTLTPAESPYLLAGNVRIPPGVTVHAKPGTTLYAAEGAHLTVEGVLSAERVSFASNQLHPDARLWHGITVQNGGRAALDEISIADASTALTCAAGGTVRLERGRLADNSVGLNSLTGTPICTVRDTKVREGRVGAQLVGGSARLSNLAFDRVYEGIRVFHEATPQIANLAFRRTGRALVVYQAVPDIRVENLALPPNIDAASLVLDGNDRPTHRWQGREYPTGRLLLR